MTGTELGRLVISCEICGAEVAVPILDARRQECPDGIYVYLHPDVTEVLVHELMHDLDNFPDGLDEGHCRGDT